MADALGSVGVGKMGSRMAGRLIDAGHRVAVYGHPRDGSGTGRNSASETKFPPAILPRTFAYGFATGLMEKDVSLYLEEAGRLGWMR